VFIRTANAQFTRVFSKSPGDQQCVLARRLFSNPFESPLIVHGKFYEAGLLCVLTRYSNRVFRLSKENQFTAILRRACLRVVKASCVALRRSKVWSTHGTGSKCYPGNFSNFFESPLIVLGKFYEAGFLCVLTRRVPQS
jgi:hypothetical protein